MARDQRNVFLNVPFDDDYAPLFDALVFVIMACGYRVRCALEEDDSGDNAGHTGTLYLLDNCT